MGFIVAKALRREGEKGRAKQTGLFLQFKAKCGNVCVKSGVPRENNRKTKSVLMSLWKVLKPQQSSPSCEIWRECECGACGDDYSCLGSGQLPPPGYILPFRKVYWGLRLLVWSVIL